MKHSQNDSREKVLITHCIIEGKTAEQISNRINCSRSAVYYKIKNLFESLQVDNKHDFVVQIYTAIIDKYRDIIEELKEENRKLKYKLQKIKNYGRNDDEHENTRRN